MLYIVYGTDTEKARTKANELYHGLLKKKPDASFYKIDAENFDASSLQEKIESQGLFEQKFIVYLDRVFQNAAAKEAVVEKRKEIGASQNVFIMLEGKIDKATLTKFEKVAEKIQSFLLPEKGGRKFGMGEQKPLDLAEFNIFSLTYPFGSRDKKKLWILFYKAMMRNIAAEEIHGVLYWQLKNMLKAPSDAYTISELKKLSSTFVEIYHEAHRGKYELMNKLEQVILAL